jgi:hypothetical protein
MRYIELFAAGIIGISGTGGTFFCLSESVSGLGTDGCFLSRN